MVLMVLYCSARSINDQLAKGRRNSKMKFPINTVKLNIFPKKGM